MTDYHLTPKEQQRIERIVPLHQAKIHLAFRADIVINNKKFKDGAVALSEHLIVLCKKSMIGKSLNEIQQIHLLDIENFSTSSDNQCKIVTNQESVQLTSKAVLRFARVLVRNYYVITTMFPSNMRFQFRPHDPNAFPPFNPHMSPSQMFQFSYNANCSYYNTSYVHDVTRFFHQMVIQGNGVADLPHLPLNELEVNLGDPLELRPLFAAMMFCPLIFGVSCSHIARPDIAMALAPLVVANRNVSLIIINDCQVEEGMQQLSSAIINNPNNNVVYWDVSDNRLRDITAFCAALAQTKANVFYLDLSNTGMTTEATSVLFKAIFANKHLWDLKYLHLKGASFSEEVVQIFSKHLSRLSAANKRVLRSLKIADIGLQVETILAALNRWPQPIENLDISYNSLKQKSAEELVKYLVKTTALKELNIAGTSLKVEFLEKIIQAISNNSKIESIGIDLSHNGLGGKKMAPVIQFFEKSNLAKWSSISLDDNKLQAGDLSRLISLLKRMPNLKKLSLSENFTAKTKGIEPLLLQILTIPSLDTLIIRGKAPKGGLGNTLIQFIKKLKTNTQIVKLDVSFNQIGDDGLNAFADILQDNHTLTEIQVNGSSPKSQEKMIKFFDVLAASKSIHCCDFPTDDIYAILNSISSSSEKEQIYEVFSSKQRNAQNAMQRNQASVGIHSDLTLKEIPELDELLDNITLEVHNRLNGIKVNEHAGLASAFGLPMPHLNENEDQLKGAITTGGGTKKDDDYDLENSNVTVIEGIPGSKQNEEEGLATLQFNSLCIRRPGTARKINFNIPDEDFDEGESPLAQPSEMPDLGNPEIRAPSSFEE